MTWTTAELRTLIRSLPPGIPSPKRKAFARSVTRAVDDYLKAANAGWRPGTAGTRAAASRADLTVVRQALTALENGQVPPPVSALSGAMQERIQAMPISKQDQSTLGACLAVARLRQVSWSKGRGKTRIRSDIRLLGAVAPGRIEDDEAKVLLSMIGFAWFQATGMRPTSRHDFSYLNQMPPIARVFAAVKSLRPAAISGTPLAAARLLGEFRTNAASNLCGAIHIGFDFSESSTSE